MRLATSSALILGLLPFAAAAQTSEPLLPLPAAPVGPQVPAASPGQTINPGETVTDRLRPGLDPIGLHTGGFYWFPRGEVDEAYNSNIFALPNPTGDWITTLQPSFDLLSGSLRNALNVHAGAAVQYYAIHPTQNTASGFGSVDGRLDIDGMSSLSGNVEAQHLYLPRTSPNSPGNAAEPVTYNNYSARMSYAQTGYRLGYRADLGLQATEYNAVPAIGGGVLPQSAADVVTPQAAATVSYELVPDYEGYVRASGTIFDYPRTGPSEVRFNSVVYRVDTGLRILPRHLIYGEVYIGYLREVFDVSSLGSASSPDAGGRLTWNVTRLTTLTFNGIRSFQTTNPTIGVIGPGYLNSVATVTVDHELRYNLLLNANAGYENDSYQGISRTDNILSVGFNVKYLLNRHLYVGPFFTYQNRTSSGNAAGLPYSQSIVMLRVSTQF